MREEYEFSNGVRGTHAAKYAAGVEVIVDGDGVDNARSVVLETDVAAIFPDSKSVNEALRLLIKTAKSVQDLPKAS